jgi:hypothetical protein
MQIDCLSGSFIAVTYYVEAKIACAMRWYRNFDSSLIGVTWTEIYSSLTFELEDPIRKSAQFEKHYKIQLYMFKRDNL